MAVRFETEIDTINTADVYKLQLLDADYSAAVILFNTLGPDGFTLTWSARGEGQRFNAIFASQLTFKISVTDAIRPDIESFIGDMVQSGDEDRFKLKVFKNNALYWTGIVLVDRITKSIPLRSLEIRAIDGLGRISSIEYNNDGVSYEGKQTIRQHLFNVLEKLGIDELFGNSELFLKSLVTWSENTLGYDPTQNILDLARLNHLALIKVDKSGQVSYNNAFRVLEEIVKMLGARLFLSDGSWWLWQVNEFKSEIRTFSNYTKTGTKTTQTVTGRSPFSTWNVTGATDLKMNAGDIEWFPPLRSVICDYKHYSTKNLVKRLSFTEQEGTVEDIDSLGETSRLQFTSVITTFSSYTALTYRGHYQKFRLKIKIGNLYLKRTARIDSNGVIIYEEMFWTSFPEWFEFFTPLITTSNPSTPIVFPFDFITPPIQQDGDLTVEFQYVNIYLTDGTVPPLIDPPTGYDIADADVVVLTLGTVDGDTNITRYEVTNTIQGNSDVIELETIFGDGPTRNSYGAIEVYNGTTWEVSDGWRRKNIGDPVEISQLLINEIISGQIKPVEKITGTFIGTYEMHYTIKDPSGNHYVFNGGSFQARLNQWNGEWFSIETANTLAGTPSDKRDFVGDPNDIAISPVDSFDPDTPLRGVPRNPLGRYIEPSNPFVNIDIISRLAGQGINGGTALDFIPIAGIDRDGLIQEGDYFTMLDPTTGNVQEFRAVRDALAGDTGIVVEQVTINEPGFTTDSIILYSTKELALNTSEMTKIKEKWYSESFTGVSGTSVTITVNGGILPDTISHIFVYVNGVHQASGWYVDGSQIKFTWSLEDNDVQVRFLITNEQTSAECCDTGSGAAMQFYKENFASVSTNFVQVSVGGGALPSRLSQLNIFIDGIHQSSGYTVQSDYIYFNTTLDSNSVQVQFFVDSPKVFVQNWQDVNGTTVTLSSKLTTLVQGSDRIMLFVDGVYQIEGYSISGSTITFNWTLDNNSVHIKVFKP